MPTYRTLTPLLPVDLDFRDYARSYEAGLTPDRFPYGLETLPEGWSLAPQPRRRRNRVVDLVRRGVRRLLDADLVGALQRWPSIRDADVIYSHSEADYLGAALLLKLRRLPQPVLVGHTIWLFADWEELPSWKRAFLRWVMSRVDLFVYNAEPNRTLGERIFPEGRHRYVPFGVSRSFRDAEPWVGGKPEESFVLAVGNDRSRDWTALAQAVAGLPPELAVRLATHQTPPGLERATVRPTSSMEELCALYRSAACLVVGLHPNAHAGGITTVLEGAAIGTPVVVADTGGLDAYFDQGEVAFVPRGTRWPCGSGSRSSRRIPWRPRTWASVGDPVSSAPDTPTTPTGSASLPAWRRSQSSARAAERFVAGQEEGISCSESSHTFPDHTFPLPSSHLATGP